jgi:hypothetical protein
VNIAFKHYKDLLFLGRSFKYDILWERFFFNIHNNTWQHYLGQIWFFAPFKQHIFRIFWDCFRISSHLRRWPCLLLTCKLDHTWKYLNLKIGSRFFKVKELSQWKCECPKWIDEKCKKKQVEKITLNMQSSPLDNH